MEIGKKIRNERKRRNVSQQELANYLNISRQAVSRWENDASSPDLNTLILIAKYFDISLEYFAEKEMELDKHEVYKQKTRDDILKEITPYILVLTSILTLVALLPSKAKVPLLFFGTIIIIFIMACLLIYYIVKNYLSK